MRKLITRVLSLSSILALAPFIAFAAEGGIDEMIEKIEMPVEIVNMILAIISAIVSYILVQKFVGGMFAQTMKYLSAAASAFAVFEVFGILEKTEIFHVTGLIEVVEFLFAALLLLSLLKFLKSVKG